MWDIVFHELRSATLSPVLIHDRSISSWRLQAREEVDDDDPDQPPEDERLWRDASAHILRCAVGRWLRNDHLRREIMQVLITATLRRVHQLIVWLCFRIKYARSGLTKLLMSLSSSLRWEKLRR